MKRRTFIAALGGALVLSPNAWAQARQVHIGLLAPVPPTPAMLNGLRDGLSERGYLEGQNLSIDVRWPKGSFDQDSGFAAELIRGGPDVIVAWTTPAVMAARRATSTIPIVMVAVSDPVGQGLITNLAHPSGNITGVSNVASDLSAKLVELLVEVVPGIKRIGVLRNPNNPGTVPQMRGTEDAARALGLQFEVVDAFAPEEFKRAFAHLSAEGIKGLVLLADASLIEHARMVAELAQRTRLPTVFQRRENVEAGGLLAYGPNLNAQFRQIAYYVDNLLKGGKPADLPVQQPTKFELVINLKTAKALGLTVPSQLLARADEVIE